VSHRWCYELANQPGYIIFNAKVSFVLDMSGSSAGLHTFSKLSSRASAIHTRPSTLPPPIYHEKQFLASLKTLRVYLQQRAACAGSDHHEYICDHCDAYPSWRHPRKLCFTDTSVRSDNEIAHTFVSERTHTETL